MIKTPKSLRLQIGIFGRTNVGKSSFLNLIAGQDVSIISPEPGTTTDIVEKTMELLPIGPVVFLDTAGVDDDTDLGKIRIEKTKKIFDRADIIVLVIEADCWTEYENYIIKEAKYRNLPFIIVLNKTDIKKPDKSFLNEINSYTDKVILCSCEKKDKRDVYVNLFKEYLSAVCPQNFLSSTSIIGDLIPKGGCVVLIIPIDIEAPKGRIILPQVQIIRDVLDNDASVIVVKENEYKNTLNNLKKTPDIVICDSQVVDKMVKDTPDGIKCTTFSCIFSRYKGDFELLVKGAETIKTLKLGDKILIAEACSHHAMEDDIGRIKIPKWFKEYLGYDLEFDVCAGRDFPDNLETYKLIIICGSCMITRTETLSRIRKATETNIPITNYGICISLLLGVLDRVLEPFKIKSL